MSATTLTAICFVLLAMAHSALGEARIIRPVLGGQMHFAMPRPTANSIIRFAWHATSLAWLAIGLSFLGVSPVITVSIAALIPGLVMLVAIPGHPGWPLFLLAGCATFYAEGVFAKEILGIAAFATVAGLFSASVVHVYWAFGGKIGIASALPESVAGSSFKPGTGLTLVVALLLAVYAAVLGAVAYGFDDEIGRWVVIAGVALFVLRAIGDAKYVGFFKTVQGTRFARADSAYFTPLLIAFAFGSSAALLL